VRFKISCNLPPWLLDLDLESTIEHTRAHDAVGAIVPNWEEPLYQFLDVPGFKARPTVNYPGHELLELLRSLDRV
jgi:hypothetical protein